MWKKGNPPALLMEMETDTTVWGTVWRFLKKLGINLPYDPASPLLGVYPEETTTLKDACAPVFIAAIFTTARTLKQPSCPMTDKWIKKLWYTLQGDITQT